MRVRFVLQVYRCTKDSLSFSSLIPLTLAARVSGKTRGPFWDRRWVIIVVHDYHNIRLGVPFNDGTRIVFVRLARRRTRRKTM